MFYTITLDGISETAKKVVMIRSSRQEVMNALYVLTGDEAVFGPDADIREIPTNGGVDIGVYLDGSVQIDWEDIP